MNHVWGMPSRLLMASVGIAVSGLMLTALPAAAQSKKVTVVLLEEPPDFDLCQAMRSSQGRILRQNVGQALTKIDPKDGSVTPLLATSWEQKDPKTWHFKLRENVKFHDGSPLNAENVVKAMNRTYYNEKIYCENRSKSGLNKDIHFKVVDPMTVEISKDTPEPIMPVRMGAVSISGPNEPMDAHQTRKPIGTGPYYFDSMTPGEGVTLKRFDGYWGAKPQVEEARFIYRNESSVRAAMVKVGEADIAPNIAVQDANDPTMDFSFLNSETTRLRIEAKTPPLNDKRVRLAVNLAIDRNALRGSVFSKDVLFATQHVVPSIAGHNHEIDKRVWPYDPEKAKALLAEAKKDGVPVDAPIRLICRLNQWVGAQESMEAILAYYMDLGLNIKLECLEGGLHTEMNNKPFKEDRGPLLFQDQHDNNNGDAVFTIFSKYGCEGSQSTICSPEVDKLSAEGAALPVGPERNAKFAEAFRILYEDVIADVMLFHMVGYARVGPRINYKPSIATNSEVELATMTFK